MNAHRFPYVLMLIVLAWGVGGCVPARVPPHLSHTPGPSVIVTDGRYTSAAFGVMRPAGWRVITSPADTPPSVIFVAPDDRALVMVAVQPITQPPAPTHDEGEILREAYHEPRIDGRELYVYAAAPADMWDEMAALTDDLIASLALAD